MERIDSDKVDNVLDCDIIVVIRFKLHWDHKVRFRPLDVLEELPEFFYGGVKLFWEFTFVQQARKFSFEFPHLDEDPTKIIVAQ